MNKKYECAAGRLEIRGLAYVEPCVIIGAAAVNHLQNSQHSSRSAPEYMPRIGMLGTWSETSYLTRGSWWDFSERSGGPSNALPMIWMVKLLLETLHFRCRSRHCLVLFCTRHHRRKKYGRKKIKCTEPFRTSFQKSHAAQQRPRALSTITGNPSTVGGCVRRAYS